MAVQGYQTKVANLQGGNYIMMGQDANGLPLIIAGGVAANDVAIVAIVGVDSLWADGSIFLAANDGAGSLYVKVNDVWTALT